MRGEIALDNFVPLVTMEVNGAHFACLSFARRSL